jgi:DNA-binding NtrC family response regulator
VPSRTVLIVDDDREAALAISHALAAPDRDVRIVTGASDVVAQATVAPVDLVITEAAFASGVSGLDIVRACRAAAPATRVLVVSGMGSLDGAGDALRAGAFDYLAKSGDIEALKATVDRALQHPADTPASIPAAIRAPTMIGRSPSMLQLYKQVSQAAPGSAPVLILGESGTGKELVARALHAHGPRAGRPFVSLNCAGMTDLHLESSLFGHVRGAFPTAVSDRVGLFETARTGTLLLDNVTEMSPAMQAQLLRVLQQREMRPMGAQHAVAVDVRVLAAACGDGEADITAHGFRLDLFFRLAVFLIRVPPLRERRQDIPFLVEHFSGAASARAGRMVTISNGAIARLRQLHWPGNVRELENVIERLVASARHPAIEGADIVLDAGTSTPQGTHPFADMPTLDELERRYLVYALQQFAGNRTRTAAALGIDRRTLYRMSARLGVPITGAEIHGVNVG